MHVPAEQVEPSHAVQSEIEGSVYVVEQSPAHVVPSLEKEPPGQPQVATSRVSEAVAAPGANCVVMHVDPKNTAEARQPICLCSLSQKHRPLGFRGSRGGSLLVTVGVWPMSQLEMSW